jgi:hypothetical protein
MDQVQIATEQNSICLNRATFGPANEASNFCGSLACLECQRAKKGHQHGVRWPSFTFTWNRIPLERGNQFRANRSIRTLI